MVPCAGCEVLRKLLPNLEQVLLAARNRDRWDWVDDVIERMRKERSDERTLQPG